MTISIGYLSIIIKKPFDDDTEFIFDEELLTNKKGVTMRKQKLRKNADKEIIMS